MHDVLQMKKSFRRSKFTLHDDNINAREVRTFRAYVAPFGEVHATFAEAAQYAYKNKNLSMRVTAMLIQYHYKKKKKVITTAKLGLIACRVLVRSTQKKMKKDSTTCWLAEMGNARMNLDKKKKAQNTANDQREKEKGNRTVDHRAVERQKRDANASGEENENSDKKRAAERKNCAKRKMWTLSLPRFERTCARWT